MGSVLNLSCDTDGNGTAAFPFDPSRVFLHWVWQLWHVIVSLASLPRLAHNGVVEAHVSNRVGWMALSVVSATDGAFNSSCDGDRAVRMLLT